MNYLVVVAHPDDEVLGAGATIKKLINEGHNVAIVTMANHAAARANLSDNLAQQQQDVFKLLGVKKSYAADFPNIKMNVVAHLDLVKFVEECIEDFEAEAIITHHPSDTNDDHVQTSHAAQVACRIAQRKDGMKPLKLVLFMEIQSSTEWSLDTSIGKFSPNYFVEIGEEGLKTKLKALYMYEGIMRPYPHPRSDKAVEALAAYRGSQAGCNYAEAFEVAFIRD